QQKEEEEKRNEMEPTRRRESVCRSLFGPVDHSQLRRDLKLKLKEIIEQDRRRWNFNFECETPLPGRFQWEEAARPKDAAHRSGGDRPSDGEDGAGTDQENCSNITNKRKSPTEGSPNRQPVSKTIVGVSALKNFKRPSGLRAG
uniref:Cyclin-dependent kinase inhibitor domain-containing protein n=1 Tax=Maylandia zebra TaxID=106582 RepID=A0A3P9C9U9_9CICH